MTDSAAPLPLTPTITRVPNHAPKAPAERRARRKEVENAFIVGMRTTVIMETLSTKYRVDPSVINRDLRLLRRRWKANEKRSGSMRQYRQLEALEQIAMMFRAKQELEKEADVRWKIGRLLGMGAAQIDARSVHVNVLQPKVVTDALLTDALQILAESGLALPLESGREPAGVRAALPDGEATRVLAGPAS